MLQSYDLSSFPRFSIDRRSTALPDPSEEGRFCSEPVIPLRQADKLIFILNQAVSMKIQNGTISIRIRYYSFPIQEGVYIKTFLTECHAFMAENIIS